MRLASYNVEWFSNLFDDADMPLADDGWSGRHDVTRAAQLEALGKVFTAIDADAVMIVEAPDTNRKRSTTRALEQFAQAFDLRMTRVVTGFASDTQQELALLYDPAQLEARHDPQGALTPARGEVPRFDGTYRIDLDIDAHADQVRFSKPPLELALRSRAGLDLRMIGVHLKSKAPHGAKTRDAVMRLSIANRRKQLAQAIWLRARIDAHLATDAPLIVLGDLNDGPGLDEYENLFGRSSVEIVMGEDLYDPHAKQALSRRIGASPTTARFLIHQENRFLQALLDYVMVSPELMARRPAWRIWHPFDDPGCWGNAELREALLTASDHYPVTLDIDI